jgi:hypothetical protein
MTGVSISTLEQLTKVRAHKRQVLQASDFAVLKKGMVEHDAPGLVEFMELRCTLARLLVHGAPVHADVLCGSVERQRLAGKEQRIIERGHLAHGLPGHREKTSRERFAQPVSQRCDIADQPAKGVGRRIAGQRHHIETRAAHG